VPRKSPFIDETLRFVTRGPLRFGMLVLSACVVAVPFGLASRGVDPFAPRIGMTAPVTRLSAYRL
jgi:hypothetical protein